MRHITMKLAREVQRKGGRELVAPAALRELIDLLKILSFGFNTRRLPCMATPGGINFLANNSHCNGNHTLS